MVKSQALLLMLEKAIKRYQNNLLTTSEIITEMINIARNVRESDQRGEQLNLTEDEIAFYDALEVNDSAVRIWGNEKLRDIAEKVKKTPQLIGRCATVPAATLMVIVRRTLNKHGTHPTNRKKQHIGAAPGGGAGGFLDRPPPHFLIHPTGFSRSFWCHSSKCNSEAPVIGLLLTLPMGCLARTASPLLRLVSLRLEYTV